MKPNELISYIRPDGESIQLNSIPTRAVRNMSGWGRPPMNVSSITGPYQHGSDFISYRLTPRTITMDLLYHGCSRSDWRNERNNLLNILGINNTPPNIPEIGTLRWEFIQDGIYTTRDIDCYLANGLSFDNSLHWHEWGLVESLDFIALNPIIYDPTEITLTLTTFDPELVLPMDFPFILGSGVALGNITYAGTWISYPTIEIDGPTETIEIENTSTGKKLKLDYDIADGETVTFILSPGEKSVTSSLGTDLINLILDSDFNEFAIEIDPIVTGGINNLKITVVNYSANTEIRIKYFSRYYGI